MGSLSWGNWKRPISQNTTLSLAAEFIIWTELGANPLSQEAVLTN